MHRRRLLGLLVVAAGLMLVAAPEAAFAHGLVGREDLPIPKWLFGWGATVVLVASFVGLAVLWREPRLEQPVERRVGGLPRVLDPIAGAIGVALFVLVVYAGFAGDQTTTNNLAPTFIFVLFWVGLAVVSPIFGDVFKALNPWRACARAVATIAAKVSRGGLPAPMAYPPKLGRWPAALGILAFAWVELVYSGRGDPSNLAVLALAYAAVQFVGMSLYGIETWNRYGDGFGVYYGLLARIAPLRWAREGLFVRRPLSGLTSLDVVPGTVALLCVIIGTTSFDGFSGGPAWTEIAPELTSLFRDIGFGQSMALELAFTIGLAAAVLIVSGLYRLGVLGMQSVDPRNPIPTAALAGRFVHSLVPIGLAYVVAHYFSLLAYEGQRVAYLASDPLGNGVNIFGTSTATVDYTWISATGIWYIQVAALVIGHVAGLVLAHDRALVSFGDGRTATRSQYWMLAVMIAFTSLGLWLLSAANS
ncbi:MAG TPA: fenitrothion hydrolase [Solirubrobacteraceae bacterium]|nr:fenitrothion hydrolase [Solirubrobacteraceae bacterium]